MLAERFGFLLAPSPLVSSGSVEHALGYMCLQTLFASTCTTAAQEFRRSLAISVGKLVKMSALVGRRLWVGIL